MRYNLRCKSLLGGDVLEMALTDYDDLGEALDAIAELDWLPRPLECDFWELKSECGLELACMVNG